VTNADGAGRFLVEIVDESGAPASIEANQVVVASGFQRVPRVPAMANTFPPTVNQIHAADYRSPESLPSGAVMVVGSGQSGCQIAEDLIRAGREVHLCTSKVGRVPRRYRGRDILEWMVDLGMFDQTVEDLRDPQMQFAAQPQVSGVGRRGKTVSLQSLQAQGVHLMGRLESVIDGVVVTNDGLAENVAFADALSQELKEAINSFIADHGIEAPAVEDDPADAPAGQGVAELGSTSLDLAEQDVSNIIWCTGFTTDLDWIHFPILDDTGHPVHSRGVSPVGGLFFLGFPWMHTRKSGIIFGIDEDADHIASVIASAPA
jgi:putative flavoprotein involved in K+ transport